MFHVNAWGLPYAAALIGAKLVLPGPHLDGKSLYELFESERVTFSAGVPTVWLGLHHPHAGRTAAKFSTLRRTVIGGSACPPAMMRTLEDDFGVEVIHAWGMTEMSPLGTLSSSKAKHADGSTAEQAAAPGRSRAGRSSASTWRSSTTTARPLPWDGQSSGNLVVRGHWVIERYFEREASPLVEVPGRGEWFPTGDVATIDADGYMQITDRSKDVIKSGGEWISSIELENIAMGHPGGARGGGHRLPRTRNGTSGRCWWWCGSPAPSLTREELLAFFEGRIAKWQIPDDVALRRRAAAHRHRQAAEAQAARAVQGPPAARNLNASPPLGGCPRPGPCGKATGSCLATIGCARRAGPPAGRSATAVRCHEDRLRRFPDECSFRLVANFDRPGGGARGLGRAGPQTAQHQAAGRTDRQDRLDRPAVGADGADRQQPAARVCQFFAEKFSATNPAGVKFEVVGIDNKLSPTESLNALKAAIDQGVRYVMQGNGSSVAGPADRRGQQAQRAQSGQGSRLPQLRRGRPRPDQQQVQLLALPLRRRHLDEDGGADHLHEGPARRSRRSTCSSQNYSHGQQVAKYAKEMLASASAPTSRSSAKTCTRWRRCATSRPTSPRSRLPAPTRVITGNWGSDLSLLVKAANEGGYNGKFFTYYAGVTGTPTALGSGGAGRVYQVAYNHYNMGGQMRQWMDEFKRQVQRRLLHRLDHHRSSRCSAQAMAKAKSTDPVKVAAAMEGLKFKSFNGEVEMRKADHQLQQPLYIRSGRRPTPSTHTAPRTPA